MTKNRVKREPVKNKIIIRWLHLKKDKKQYKNGTSKNGINKNRTH